MAQIPSTRGNPQASDVAVQTALPMVGSASREDLQATLTLADAELAKLFEDRNVQLIDGGVISFSGTALQFTQSLKLHINSRATGGSPTVIDLGSTTRTVSADGRMVYAVVNRTAGTATVTDDASALPAVTSTDQEVFLLAKRVGTEVYLRDGSRLASGHSASLGRAGSVLDSEFTIRDSSDATKQLAFDAAGSASTKTTITSSQTTNRTQTLQDATDTFVYKNTSDVLTNKSLSDSTTAIVDVADNTKQIKFDAAGNTSTSTTITSSQTANRTQTLQDATDTFVYRNTTDQLTNKQVSLSSVNDSTTTGANATLQAFTTGIIRLTNASLTSVSGIPAGSSGQLVIVENKTGNQISINNEETGATAANRIQTGTSSAVFMPNNATFMFTYDSTSSRWQLTAGSGSGGGSGSKNYLSSIVTSQSTTANTGNGDFSLGTTTGWSLGTVGTLTNNIPTGSPTFGSGASANLSISTVSSGHLAGSYSLSYTSSAATTQGNMLASDAFYIDTEDQAKVLTWKFYYKAQTNPTNANWSGTSSNSFGVAVYDVTNSSWLSSTANFGMTQSSGVGLVTGTCQTNSNTTQLRLVVYNANATTGAVTVYFDDFQIGPQTAPIGVPITSAEPYTPTIGAGLGTATNVSAFYKREADYLIVTGSLTTGAVAASLATISLPSGLSIDSSKITIANTSANPGLAVGKWSSSAANQFGDIVTATSTSTTLVYLAGNNAGSTRLTPTNGNSIVNNSAVVSYEFRIPILGWSANVTMSKDTDTRVVAASVNQGTSNLTISANTTINFPTVEFDTHGMYSAGTFTIPVTGKYQVSVNEMNNATTGYYGVYVNGSLASTATYGASGVIGFGTTTIDVKSGDLVTIKSTGAGTLTYAAGQTKARVMISRLAGPSVIAASEKIVAKYYIAQSAAITNGVNINYNNKVVDTHGAVSSGVFTAPVSGQYFVNTTLRTNSASTVVTIYKNGSSYMDLYIAPTNQYIAGGGMVDCLAGDTISIRPNTTGTIQGSSYLDIFYIK